MTPDLISSSLVRIASMAQRDPIFAKSRIAAELQKIQTRLENQLPAGTDPYSLGFVAEMDLSDAMPELRGYAKKFGIDVDEIGYIISDFFYDYFSDDFTFIYFDPTRSTIVCGFGDEASRRHTMDAIQCQIEYSPDFDMADGEFYSEDNLLCILKKHLITIERADSSSAKENYDAA